MIQPPLTSFGRAIDAARVQQNVSQAAALPRSVNKWAVLRELSAGRAAFGLSDRDMTVLQALLSFHPGDELSDPKKLIIHAANATICARLHDMPCSTMRRHLANLIEAGVIRRQSSPNGKRYVRRGPAGPRSFGLDLTPLLERGDEFLTAAEIARTEDQNRAFLRETISLLRRDLTELTREHEGKLSVETTSELRDLADLTARALRRKLNSDELTRIEAALTTEIERLHLAFGPAADESVSVQLSSNDAENEQHQQSSKKEYLESESAQTIGNAPIALDLVLQSCPEILCYAERPVQNWPDFSRLAERIRPMLGIQNQVWAEARSVMGLGEAAATIAAILQKLASIRSPGAYLRSLTRKARLGKFSVGPMLMALSRPRGSQL